MELALSARLGSKSLREVFEELAASQQFRTRFWEQTTGNSFPEAGNSSQRCMPRCMHRSKNVMHTDAPTTISLPVASAAIKSTRA